MKVLSMILVLILICTGTAAFGASILTQTRTSPTYNVEKWTLSWTAHTDGSFTSTASTWNVDGYILLVVTDPGSPAPTDNYGITLTDSDGIDVMGGALANRDTSTTEEAIPSNGARFVSGKITIAISSNAVNGAKGIIYIYIYKEGR